MRTIKVCHVITRFIHGGAQENTLITVNGLDSKRFAVTLVGGPPLGPRGGILHQVRKGVRTIIIPEMRRKVNPVYDLVAFWKLYRLFRKEQFYIVHTHSTQAGIYGRLAAKLAGVPIIVHTIHGLAFHGYLNPIARGIAWLGEKIASTFTDKIICVADAMITQSVQGHIAPRSRFVTIRSGFDTDAFAHAKPLPDFRKRYRIPSASRIIAQVGGLVPLKGCEDFLNAATLIAKAQEGTAFVFVGDGELRPALEEQAMKLGIADQVRFIGMVPAKQLPRVLASIDILVHASVREGLPRVLPQALAARRPCIAVDIDGTREVIRQKTGLLVPPNDPKAIVGAVQKMLANPAIAKRMATAGQKLVVPMYRQEKMMREITRIYEGLLR